MRTIWTIIGMFIAGTVLGAGNTDEVAYTDSYIAGDVQHYTYSGWQMIFGVIIVLFFYSIGARIRRARMSK